MPVFRECKFSPKFSDRSFFVDVRAACPCSNACFSQDLKGLTEVFGRMSAGVSGRKLPLGADFSFLSFRRQFDEDQHCATSDLSTIPAFSRAHISKTQLPSLSPLPCDPAGLAQSINTPESREHRKYRKQENPRAVLDGVPPTGLQLLR